MSPLVSGRKRRARYTLDKSQLEFARILAFSDAVFAIAMTLLIVTVDIPTVAPGNVAKEFAQALANSWLEIFTYFLSFAVIGLYWLDHHRLFAVAIFLGSIPVAFISPTAGMLTWIGAAAFRPLLDRVVGRVDGGDYEAHS